MSTALATIDKITAAELFKPGASKTIIDKVEEEARELAAIMVAESNAKKAAEKAEADRLAAVEAERQRAADEQRKAQEEATKRENNRKHAARINNEAKHAIAATCNLTDEQAMRVVEAIAKGLILHTKISY